MGDHGHEAAHGATTLFTVPFASAMSAPDVALLVRELDLVTNMHRKMFDSPASPGVARLDFESGLFLLRDGADGRWVLEARTWGHPSPRIVHGWHVQAADAARQLDHTVIPVPLDAAGRRRVPPGAS